MRLNEFAPPKFYLSTNTAQQVDDLVSLDVPIYWLDKELENKIEAERPKGRLSRKHSLILDTVPGGSEFTYLVKIVGGLERQNVGWLQRLQASDPLQSGVLAHYAIGYWSGAECPEVPGADWEYRASKVKILARIGRSAR